MVKKIIAGVAGVVVLLIAVVLIAAAMQPTDYKITRSAKMKAPPAAVFAQVNDFHNWRAWSPWEKLDPNMERKFAGPEAGDGAKYSWSGNDKVGEGNMEITESQAPDEIAIRLEFVRPMADVCTTGFAFKPEGDETLVTWTMTGKNEGLINKAFCMFMNLDAMVGKDFEAGLAAIKKIVEKESPASSDTSTEPAAVPPAGEIPPPGEK